MEYRLSIFAHSLKLITASTPIALLKMSHVKFDSDIKQSAAQEKVMEAKVEKFSDAVTLILRTEAAAKSKKLVYVFINVRQLTPTMFRYTIDDSRDKISSGAHATIKTRFEEIFQVPVGK